VSEHKKRLAVDGITDARRADALKRFYNVFVRNNLGPCYNTTTDRCLYRAEDHPGCAVGILPEFQEAAKDLREEDLFASITTLVAQAEDASGARYRKIAEVFGPDIRFYSELQSLHDHTVKGYAISGTLNNEGLQRVTEKVEALAYRYGIRADIKEVPE
jgi:hypothetical protein